MKSKQASLSVRRHGNNGIPERGDAIWIQFNPQSGREQAGHRPAIVLSPSSYNSRTGLAILCPITNQVKKYPFEVSLPDGIKLSGVILSDQVKSLDWRVRKASFICKLPASVVEEVVQKLSLLILL